MSARKYFKKIWCKYGLHQYWLQAQQDLVPLKCMTLPPSYNFNGKRRKECLLDQTILRYKSKICQEKQKCNLKKGCFTT